MATFLKKSIRYYEYLLNVGTNALEIDLHTDSTIYR